MALVDPNVWGSWRLRLEKLLRPFGRQLYIEILPDNEPNIEYLNVLAIHLVELRPQIILSIGGGATIDSAKYMKLFMNQKVPGKYIHFAAPTTIGPGAEASPAAIIRVAGKKKAFVDDDLCPDYVLVIPELSGSLPTNTTIACLLDGIAHCFETFTCKACPAESRALALEAARVLTKGLWGWKSMDNIFREELIVASYRAARALTKASVHIIHATSRAVEENSEGRHGECVAAAMYTLLGMASDLGLDVLFKEYFARLSYRDLAPDILEYRAKCLVASGGIRLTGHEFLRSILTYPGLEHCPIMISAKTCKLIGRGLFQSYSHLR